MRWDAYGYPRSYGEMGYSYGDDARPYSPFAGHMAEEQRVVDLEASDAGPSREVTQDQTNVVGRLSSLADRGGDAAVE